ncbi:MAG: DsbC family protein [Burkholderiales bacterium]|mgnify:CR=1 FL=1|nr:DsbC family protein [Burkholderiales bacterium]
MMNWSCLPRGGVSLAALRSLALAVALAVAAPMAGQAQAQSTASPSPGAAAASAPFNPNTARLKAALEAFLEGKHAVDEVRNTPVVGLYEARIGNELLYIDEKGQHLIFRGQLHDMKTRRNLTQERIEELSTIDFKTLPLDLAIKQVIGNGKRVVAVFEDPNCGFCKAMRADLLKVSDITIYTFPLAFLAADSETKAAKALCAANKARAWNEMMVNNRVPGNSGTCATPLRQVAELARRLGISGTPVMYFSNGKRTEGQIPLDRLNEMLAENSAS